MIFEVSKRVDEARVSTLSLVRESSVGRDRATGGYLFPTAAKGDRDGQKQESTYVRSRSVPLRDGEDTTDSVASKGVSFRVVSGTSVTPGVVYLPVRVSVRRYARKRRTRDVHEKIVEKMHPSQRDAHRVRIALLSLGEYENRVLIRRISSVASCARANRQIHASMDAPKSSGET